MTKSLREFLVSWPDPSARVLSWQTAGIDNNDRARRLLQLIATIQRRAPTSEETFLSAIELEMEPEKFPAVLSKYFSDPTWSFSKRFCSERTCKSSSNPSVTIGHLTFEDGGGELDRLVQTNEGIRWGSALRIGGYRAPDSVVGHLIDHSIFDRSRAPEIMRHATLIWYATANLDGLDVWTKLDGLKVLDKLCPAERVT